MARLLTRKRNAMILFLAGMILLLSCHKKDEFLDKKPNTNLVVPSTLPDFQALLDYDIVMSPTPVLGDISADNFYFTYNFWLSALDNREHNAYIWLPDIYAGQGQIDDWNIPYQQVFYSNVVLAGLPGVAVDSSNMQQWNALKGAALFMRAYAFYNIAQLFAPVYDTLSAATDLGIPLRLSPDVNIPSVRSSVQQTYTQILSDLKVAVQLLPEAIPFANLNRPSRPAAYALLARIYLSVGAYAWANAYADSCLGLYNTLIDYNTISKTSNTPFAKVNAETMYQSNFAYGAPLGLIGSFCSGCIVDSSLYGSYNKDDLRKTLYYRINSSTGLPGMKGSYSGSQPPFSGMATDEAYLIRAECAARAGNTGAALNDLNTLLSKRWVTGTYTPYATASAGALLDTILVERRKELPFRGVRWTDLRRLNKGGANITLTRLLNGQLYQLAPNSRLYVLPIPPDVIALSGMQQNPR